MNARHPTTFTLKDGRTFTKETVVGNTPEHARGPWSSEHDGHGGIYVGDADDRQVGFVSSHPKQAENARLFVASPDLLWTLKDCVIALEHLQNTMGLRVNPPTLENAKDAIAKAERED